MPSRNAGKIFLGPFIITTIVLVIIIISAIFAIVSQTTGNVQKGTEEHAISDMENHVDEYAKSMEFALSNNITDFDLIFTSDFFTYKITFLTDMNGNILGKSDLAKYSIREDNIFDHFSDGEYLNNVSENDIRTLLRKHEAGSFCVNLNQKEYLVFQPVRDSEYLFFYMLHQGDVERIYSESAQYMKTMKSLGVAYITATLGLVIMMVSYIIHVAKSSEFRLYKSRIETRNALEQARIYSDITRVLSQTYTKIYYINLSDDHYRVFSAALMDQSSPMEFEGEDFWNVVSELILDDTLEEDRQEVRDFFNKDSLLKAVREEGSKRVRFRMLDHDAAMYFYARAYLTESEGQQYLIVGLKNVDAMVIHDMKQLSEKDAALRRVEIYQQALLHNMVAYLELDITEGRIVEGPYIGNENSAMKQIEGPAFMMPEYIDELAVIWGRYLYQPGPEQDEYIRFTSCRNLRAEFEKSRGIAELNFDAKWADGSVRSIRQNYYMSRREEDGHIVALCVLYDMTEKVAHEREIRDLTEELNQSRIKISTSQMQPHFLYNVLGSIREIILDDPQYASDLICDFTTHLRACIRSMSNDDLIPFSREVDNIKAYVNIERMRFGDRMRMEFDIRYTDFKVVPLSIQPLVENAIRHGLYPKTDGEGIVWISSSVSDGMISIIVRDNGVGFDYDRVNRDIQENKRDSTGLLNLTLRLEKVLDAKVHVDSKPGEGTTVTITIPVKKEGIEE